MNTLKHKTIRILLGAVVGVLCTTPLLADDIEIYVGTNVARDEVRPNLLFIVDTSGSMSAEVLNQADYDPTVDYAALGGCFDADRIYYSTGRTPSSCSTSSYFNKTALKCSSAMNSLYNVTAPVLPEDPALATGWYQDRMAMWKEHSRSSRRYWTDFWSSQKDWIRDCKTDFADTPTSGEGAGDGNYIANYASGPYSTTTKDWGSTGRGYVLYSGNYLNWTKVAAAATSTRLEVVKEVTYDVVDSSNNINIGLMRFSSNSEGGMITYPVLDVTAARGDFKSRLQTYTPGGGTPLSEVLYEAYLYWSGKDVDYGLSSSPSHSIGSSRKDGALNSEYLSPIEYQCQKNFNILLSDGDAWSDGSADAKIAAIPDFTTVTGGCIGNCLDELAEYMNTQDIYDGIIDKQNVSTYTVGFAIDHALLKETANKGGAKYYTADNAAELTEVFTKIIAEILSVNTTFSAPAVSINAFNRTTHRQDLYFTLFKPATTPHWNGNLKRFKLSFNGDVPFISDANDANAVNELSGFFKDDAVSYWTQPIDSPDGGEVSKGGAAGMLTNTRTIYTYTASTSPVNVNLNTSTHEFNESNAAITLDMLGIPAEDAAYREHLIRWARSIDVDDDNADGSTTDARRIMGDPLHSEPALIQYGGTDADPDITAYVATNDGYLHAVNTSDGTERFAFIPQELLPLLNTLYGDSASEPKAYGLDGSVSAWVEDANKNGVIESPDDHVYIYFGMRRGGNKYYAMDVTDRDNPKLMWVIQGGVGDYAELGDTWSNIQVKKIKLNGSDKQIVVFGGGYDSDQDGASTRTADNIGRAIYIADAETGQRLWWAGPNGSGADMALTRMNYSIPSRLKAVDVSGNGYTDRIYVGDMGGQLWRFDIDEGDGAETLSQLIDGDRIADIAGNTAEENRRLYYPPDVAFIVEPDKAPYLAVAFTTGYRAHPLNTTIQDRIYMIRDYDLYDSPACFSVPSSCVSLTEADLYDATDNLIGQGADKAAEIATLESLQGWFVQLNESGSWIGEKGLSEVLIIEGQLIATTYIPSDPNSTEACVPQDGVGRVYFMNIADATPKYEFDGIVDPEGDLTAEDRFHDLKRGGIPPNPAPLFTEEGSAVIVGTETVENPVSNDPVRLFWYEQ